MLIFLNGASSAGKTSIAEALQEIWPAPLLHSGIDHYSRVIPSRYIAFDPQPGEPGWEGFRWITGVEAGLPVIRLAAGPLATRWMADMRRFIAGLAALEDDLVVDESLIEAGWVRHYLDLLGGRTVWMVGVRCALPTLVRREMERNRHVRGQARGTHVAAHAHCLYDFEVDTAEFSPLECARQVVARIEAGPPPAAFEEMRRRLAL